MNRQDFSQCFVMIDPRVLDKSAAVTISQYKQSLHRCFERVGSITVVEVRISGMHINEPTKLYEGRDFAIGKTVWEDEEGNRHEFAERWVFEDGEWYTRSTGLALVEPAEKRTAVPPSEKASL